MTENIWRGDKVRLRAWEPEDWQAQLSWRDDTAGNRRASDRSGGLTPGAPAGG